MVHKMNTDTYRAKCPNCKQWTNVNSTYGTFSCCGCNYIFDIPKVQVNVLPQVVGTYVAHNCSQGTIRTFNPPVFPQAYPELIGDDQPKETTAEKIKKITDDIIKKLDKL